MDKLFSLEGRVAVITGAASGQGLATARLFARAGASVILLDRDEAPGLAAAEEIRAAGGTAMFKWLDLEDAPAIAAASEEILSEFGYVDILFNNAGIGFNPKYQLGSIFDISDEDWRGIIGVNLDGTMRLTRALVPSMRARRSGVVLFNSSISALMGMPGIDPYTASKGAIIAFARALAVTLGPDNIRVNTLAPGAIMTPMLTPVLTEEGHAMRIQTTPLRRIGLAEEVASVALFLASDAASFVSGQVIAVDGGRSIT